MSSAAAENESNLDNNGDGKRTTYRHNTRKAGGTIADVFVNLGAKAGVESPRISELKRCALPNSRSIQQSWDRLIDALKKEKEVINKSKGDDIPEIDFSALKSQNTASERGSSSSSSSCVFPKPIASRIKKCGAVVIRNVIPKDVATKWKKDLKAYIHANTENVIGYPPQNPVVYEIYWSKPQIEARQHDNIIATIHAVNSLWNCTDKSISLDDPRIYVDRCRIRKPGDKGFALSPHIDNGSLERWEDPSYRKIYDSILAGDWESFDPFNANGRNDCVMDMHNAPNACSFFRTFQGWVSLTSTGAGEGSLHICPRLKESISYVMLRPLLDDVPSGLLCGASPGRSQEITNQWHEHLIDIMCPIPSVEPGDMVFWHCDAIHAVDPVHEGNNDSAVLYIPAGASCTLNDQYLKHQWEHFLEGKTPPDFPGNDCEVKFNGRASPADITNAGKEVLGR